MAVQKKTVLILVLTIVALLAALLIIVPMVIDLDRYRPTVIAYLQRETGKPVSIRRLQLTLFPALSVRADDVVLGNPRGFPPGDFITAKHIYAKLRAGALWRRQVVIESLVLDQPAIALLSDGRGHWNYQNPAYEQPVRQAALASPPRFTFGVISKLEARNANLTVASLLPPEAGAATLFEARGVASTLEHVDLGSLAPPGVPAGSASREPLVAALDDALSRLAIAASAPSDSARQATTGDLEADALRFGPIETSNLESKVRIVSGQVFLDDLRFDAYDGHGTGNLVFNFGTHLLFHANTRVSGLDVAKLLAAIPEGAGKITGKMDCNFDVSGEASLQSALLAGVRGSGQVTIRNGRLPTLRLDENLIQLARVSGLGPGSRDPAAFSLFSADLSLADQRITSRKVTIVGNGTDIDGSGTLNLASANGLDYRGTARIAAKQDPLTSAIAGLSGATYANGQLSFPFALSGNVQNPRLVLESAEGHKPSNPPDLFQGLQGLVKKKKSP
ncbi:MAG TPA: AsmA family protein [Terriglobia bacterium]|nr:AsmA family protein [Terriglobia bacterium]